MALNIRKQLALKVLNYCKVIFVVQLATIMLVHKLRVN